MRPAFGVQWIADLGADLRYAVRLLRKSPAFAGTAISPLALPISANTTIFSVANEMHLCVACCAAATRAACSLCRWPVPANIHGTWGSNFDEDEQARVDSLPLPFYRQLQQDSPASTGIFAFKHISNLNVSSGGEA